MADSVFIERLQIVDSTNRYIRDEAVRLWSMAPRSQAVAVVSENQTAGRGQRGNVWHSDGGVNLLLSIMVRPTFLAAAEQFLLSEAVALSLHRTLSSYGIDTVLKWPNDIYVGRCKIAGVLVELDYEGKCVEQAIIGIGLNVNQADFPQMDKLPTSMKNILGYSVDKDKLLAHLLDSFLYYYNKLRIEDAAALHNEYKQRLLGLGVRRPYTDEAGAFDAVIEDVEPTGHLLIRRTDGSLCRYAFKEIVQIV